MSAAPGFRETEIRPDELMAEQARRYEADVRRLLQRRSEFVDIDCPACGEAAASPQWRKYELDYVRCDRCGTVYVDPRPTPAILDDYYTSSENYVYWNTYIFPASEDARREKIFRPRAERLAALCARHGIPTRTLLEVGAGFGTFAQEVARLRAFDRIVAVEPTPSLAATCRARGLEVIESRIEDVRLDGPVDVVASFEVIEHLFSPREFVRGCAEALAPGGALVLSCPNVRGFDIVTLGPLSGAVDTEHLNYFHPASLSALVGSEGFDVVEVLTPGKLDAELVRKKALSGQFDLRPHPVLEQILIHEWDRLGERFQVFLADNMLSSHLWLVARKR